MTKATAYVPANIALAKYWGKRDRQLNLPTNGSLSISLGKLGTTTTLEESQKDSLSLNGKLLDLDSVFSHKVWQFIDKFAPQRPALKVTTVNTIPTAAGLASSASGFAALILVLDRFFARNLSDVELSVIARQGSGSACRSLWHGFVKWNLGTRADGKDSFAQPLKSDWQTLRIAIIDISTAEKKISSRDGMNHTLQTSPLFSQWSIQAEKDLSTIEQAIIEKNFITLGQTAEANAMMMHATMLAARPPLSYWQAESLTTLQKIWRLREQGLEIFATMDAGPNIKILYQNKDEEALKSHFPKAIFVNPFQNEES